MNQKVAIIILNWNNYEDTIACVHSVQKSTYPRYEIIIVDNGSTNGSQKILEKEFPHLKVIQTGKNLGYSGGNNQGIRCALERGAELLWVLNPDTVVAPDALEKMGREVNKTGIGVVAPKIYFYDSPNKVWFVGGILNMRTGQVGHEHEGEVDEGQFDKENKLEWATGASLLIKREVFGKIGLFDERYFLFYEDVDFCVRAGVAGFKIFFAPKAKIWHNVGASVGRETPNNTYYITRSRLYFVRKFNRPLEWVIFTILHGRRLATWFFKSKLTGRNKEHAQAAWEGFLDFLRGNYGIRR